MPYCEAMELILIMLPPPFAIMDFTTSRDRANMAITLVWSTWKNSSSLTSVKSFFILMPALFTRISTCPHRSVTCCTNPGMAGSSLRSRQKGWHNSPSLSLAAFNFCSSRPTRSEEHTSELQSLRHLVCRLLLEKKKKNLNSLLLLKKKTQKNKI